jgi:hypothetical protein
VATAPDVLSDAALEAQPRIARLVKRRVFYASVATALLIVALTWGYPGVMAQRVVSGAMTTDLARARRLVQRVQDERLSHLAIIADLMASFPNLKALFENTDPATVGDFLMAHQAHIPGTPTLAALLPGGRVLARTNASAAPPAPGDTWIDTLVTKNTGPAVVTIDGRLYHAASAAADAGGRTDRSLEISIGARRFDLQESPLSARPALAAIIAKSRDDAAAPYRQIQKGLLIIVLIGVAVAVAGAYWMARGATHAIAVQPSSIRSRSFRR